MAGRGVSPSEELSPTALAERIQSYLADHAAAAVLQDGRVLFDMRSARFSVTDAHGRCVLQFWNEERNLVRTIVAVQNRASCLRLTTRRLGNPKPETLELAPTSDRRTSSTRDAARRSYQKLLERVLVREFPGHRVEGMRSAMDLEHSFGPAYARGRLVKGGAAHAIIGVGCSESSTTVDGVLTLGLLWLDYCRRQADERRHVGGLIVVVPPGSQRTTAERIAWLDRAKAHFQLFTLDERSEEFAPVDSRDLGNLEYRLVHAFSPEAAIERCASGIRTVLSLVPETQRQRVEVLAHSATAVGLLLHGLEFARVRQGASRASFGREEEITFGAGAHEIPLNEETEPVCRELLHRLFLSRHPEGAHTDPLFRLQPERWLESRLRGGMTDVLPGVRRNIVYSQVPALSSTERGMLDLLTIGGDGRLIVIEIKADEDLHLPLQALDYWISVHALNRDRGPNGAGRAASAFEKMGYFAGCEVSPLPPRIVLAAPALRIHPANEPVLRYLSPLIDWELIGLGEFWRRDLKVAFRKRGGAGDGPAPPRPIPE